MYVPLKFDIKKGSLYLKIRNTVFGSEQFQSYNKASVIPRPQSLQLQDIGSSCSQDSEEHWTLIQHFNC